MRHGNAVQSRHRTEQPGELAQELAVKADLEASVRSGPPDQLLDVAVLGDGVLEMLAHGRPVVAAVPCATYSANVLSDVSIKMRVS